MLCYRAIVGSVKVEQFRLVKAVPDSYESFRVLNKIFLDWVEARICSILAKTELVLCARMRVHPNSIVNGLEAVLGHFPISHLRLHSVVAWTFNALPLLARVGRESKGEVETVLEGHGSLGFPLMRH